MCKYQEALEVKTVYGYSVKDLVIIAELLRENQISIDDLKQNVDMVRVGVNIANKIQEVAKAKICEVYEMPIEMIDWEKK